MRKHIVILKTKYFNMIQSGEKTIESRFSIHKIAPFEKVTVGDLLLIKETGKDVTMTAKVARVEYFFLTPQKVEEIRIKYGKQIGTDKAEDWVLTAKKNYGTLIWVTEVKKVAPIPVPRSNGAGWIICKD